MSLAESGSCHASCRVEVLSGARYKYAAHNTTSSCAALGLKTVIFFKAQCSALVTVIFCQAQCMSSMNLDGSMLFMSSISLA